MISYCIIYLLHIKKRRYHQNYYITHFFLLIRVKKFSHFKTLIQNDLGSNPTKVNLFLFFQLFRISAIILIINNIFVIFL